MSSKPTTMSKSSDEADSFRLSLSKLRTPSVLERVADWIGINEKNSSIFEDHTDTHNPDTFFRCDYKSDKTSMHEKINYNSASVFNKCVPLCESIDSKYKYVKKNDKLTKTIKKFNSKSIHMIAPSSVENKKKELCSYLKLMTRDVKKQIFHPGCRRSTRVQNLEKKKEILKSAKVFDDEICSEKSLKTNRSKLSNRVEALTPQSFEDFNIIEEDTSEYPLLRETINENIFNFIMPPNNVLQEFHDFQHWIKPFISSKNPNDDKLNLHQIDENVGFIEVEKKQCHNENPRMGSSQTKEIVKRKKEVKRVRKLLKLEDIPSVISIERKEIEKDDEIETESDASKIEQNCSINNLTLNSKIENDCTIIIHNDVVISNTDSDQNSTYIEKEAASNPETENIKIRIDYEVQFNEKQNVKKSQFDDIQMANFLGFSKSNIDKSKEIVSKFNFYKNIISCVPDKNEVKEHFEKTITKSNGFCVKSAISQNCIIISDIEEIESECSVTSDSLESSKLSNNSSSSQSSSMSGNISRTKQSTPVGERIKLCDILQRVTQVQPSNEKNEFKPLHDLLMKKSEKVPSSVSLHYLQDWDSDNSLNGKRKFSTSRSTSHSIIFNRENGSILNAIYDNFHVILVQEFAVSIWNQTSLGNVLGAQNLWIFKGDTKKLILNRECLRKKSLEMTISMDNCVAYVELWTKEHKSDIRQGPVADVFAIVYFWLQKLNKMDKKVHQLENINGFSDDVQYVVLKSSLEIAVSWHSVINDVKITQVHIYTLASDFQTIVNARAFSKVEHYVSSLHNIEDCEELLMGCGEHTITLWNIEHGYIVASIKLNDIKLSLSALWTKCDRGILFIVQQCVDKELRLIAINGRTHSWKKLKSFKPSEGFERIQSVYIENGVLICFYEEGLLCWKALTEEQILEETHETDVKYFPSGKYVVMTTEKSVFVKHVLTHLLTSD